MEKISKAAGQHSIHFLRRRKFLVVLPVLVLPFVLLLVWALGLAGDVQATPQNGAETAHRLNLNLPAAVPGKDSAWNKLRYYEQADKDSVKLRALLKNDPYRKGELISPAETLLPASPDGEEKSVFTPTRAAARIDDNEARVYRKLAALNAELEKAAEDDRRAKERKQATKERDTTRPEQAIGAKEVDRLERMMQTMNSKQEDPELDQLNQMLEKILDIQHPDRMEEKVRKTSLEHKRQVYNVNAPATMEPSLLEPSQHYQQLLHSSLSDSIPVSLQKMLTANRFYSLNDGSEEASSGNVFAALIHEDQTLVSGGTVRLRLLEELIIAGVKVPKDHFVFATAMLNGERLSLSITSVAYGQYILPVSLTVYDQKDGMAGIRIPGVITREVAQRTAVQSAQNLGAINSLDPSLGAQVATAGIQAAQTLVRKSAKLVQVTLTAGYPVFLKDENGKDQ